MRLALTAGGAQGYKVPLKDDHEECFYYAMPDAGRLLGLGFKPIVGDSRVVHHWLLYEMHDASLVPGTSGPCTVGGGSGTILAGWAPGGAAYGLPPDVGLRIGTDDNAVLMLDVHYNNVGKHADAVDKSGVELCATKRPMKHEAAVHGLGTQNLLLLPGQSTATGTCRPQGEVHILSVTPHMHKLGTHATMFINRVDGTREKLLDRAFSFENQTGYAAPAVLQPGDTITSNCTFNNTTGWLATFGPASSNEMCYMWTVAYPIGPMNRGGDLLGINLAGGSNSCMQ